MLIFVSLYFICRGPPLSFCTLLGFSLIFLELFFLLFLKLRLIFFVQLQSSYMQGITNCVFLNEIAINMCKVSRFFYLSNIVISVTVKRAVWKIKKLSESPGTLPMVAQLCKNGSKNWQNLSLIYNLHLRRNRPKMRFGHNFLLGVLLAQGQCVWTALCKIFQGYPTWPYLARPNMCAK